MACAALLTAMPLIAQANNQPLALSSAIAPVPDAIRNAKTIFLSNGGADSGLFPSPFSGTVERPFAEMFTVLLADSSHPLVRDPAAADLVLELSLQAPSGPQEPSKAKGASEPLPMLKLVVYDRKTHYVLWTLTRSVEGAMLHKSHDRNLDVAIQALAADFQELTRRSAQ